MLNVVGEVLTRGALASPGRASPGRASPGRASPGRVGPGRGIRDGGSRGLLREGAIPAWEDASIVGVVRERTKGNGAGRPAPFRVVRP